VYADLAQIAKIKLLKASIDSMREFVSRLNTPFTEAFVDGDNIFT
jgi:hypothetical protein